MRAVLMLAWLAMAPVATGGCLDDCLADDGGSGPDYEECVLDCGVCGNGELEGDEECDDGNTVGGDCCAATCQPEPAGSPCEEDDELCTTDACDGDGECEHEETPSRECRCPVAPGASSLVMRDAADDPQDRLVWTWRRGAVTRRAEFGDPTAATDYALCVYDGTGLVASVAVPAAGRCGPRACWAAGPGGFRHRNGTGDPEGARLLVLRAGRRDGRARLLLRAMGENLDLPDLGALEWPLTVQLRQSGSRVCWAARYAFPPARRNDETRFRDRSVAAPSSTTTEALQPEE